MKNIERVKKAFDRNLRAASLKPGIAKGTATTRVTMDDALTCKIEDGDWRLIADYPEKSGGNGLGPDPGVLGRSALGSCLAIGYAMWAARNGILIRSISIEVEADYDARGHLGLAEVPIAYEEVRYNVQIESDADKDEIVALLDEADRLSSYLEVFRAPQKMVRTVEVVTGEMQS